ncbi:bifunctional glycosyltransferase/CDP-glycerol:glycerophosphate glycerophosphotransferase [Streptomyces sp. SPB074]|uniref:bifunctional glycosyltransferase/CDP-glycerol:glycerophosphate glycerophosphotransferase n=1 Tax=Streptomyces sp. (strain SPB074) TaxID=465543 RepID=UPI00017F2568|nr:bifunctional glycosyltransferase family 2 protein/CDP-glycerol:glycerophosphate glycerophosphotransferase [Streptomyces sp. SPB074]EDY42413.1 CDP-glycerol:polyglycerol phosphate glycero-phosphotransferase [Streptomyces sp. SPB074]
MPRFTIVVPVFKVQGYLAACLDSVLAQDFDDYEVIGVDDCSPDASGTILDEFARRDARITPLHLVKNVGLSGARNAGLARATGEYVLFLDSDDTLTPGSLRAMAARLEATGPVDVLIYDYARTYWDGRLLRNTRSALLTEEGAAAFPLRERPELLSLLQIAWNKAYRREFIEELGLRFPPGYYEDTPWTYATLLAAGSLAVLDRVCVHYRQRREGGNILRTVSRKHFDVFDQYARVYDFLDALPDGAHWHTAMFERMIDHYLKIIKEPGRLPEEARAEFFHRAAADYRDHLPEGFVRPSGGKGYKYALLERDNFLLMSGVGNAAKGRRVAKTAARQTINQSKRKAMGLLYRSHRQADLDPNLALFSSYWSRSVSCNPAAVAAEASRLAPHIRQVWAIRPDRMAKVPAGVHAVPVGSREFWAMAARATYFVNNVNFADTLVKREGQIHVQTHHGTPLKKMGLDQRDYPVSTGMDFTKLMERVDRWDYSLSSNGYSTRIWERVYPSNYTTLESGYPRNDVLVNATADDVRAARAELGLGEGTTAFLYMPTHRDYEREFHPRLDLAALAARLGPDTAILVRGHYFYDTSGPLAGQHGSARVIDVSAHPRVETLYLASDALITDYSSAMFDYATLDRPIVIYADDWDIYSTVRGTYFDLRDEPPGAVAFSEEELVDILRSDEWRDAESASDRAAFRRRFCEFDDGHAAERVVRRVFLGEQLIRPVTPVAERTPVPSPSELALPAPSSAAADQPRPHAQWA